jgi:aspartate/methionine/tyrosine aminotransferase
VSLHYPGTTAEDVLVCVPNEGIYITMSALVSPGDTVVVMYPVYQTLVEVVRALGAHVKLWNMEIVQDEGEPSRRMKAGFRCLGQGWLV